VKNAAMAKFRVHRSGDWHQRFDAS